METKKMLPIGIEYFEDMRQREYYYVDKTGLIRELLGSERMGYEEKLRQDDIETVLKYGIACNRKKCRVVVRHQQQELRE